MLSLSRLVSGRMKVNLLLLFLLPVISLAVLTNIVEAVDNYIIVWTPHGNAFAGIYLDGGGDVTRSDSHADQAGVQYRIYAKPYRWGLCSPDMECPYGWKIKDSDFKEGFWVNRTPLPDPKVSNLIDGISIGEHYFQKYSGVSGNFGYASDQVNNKYANWGCWNNGPNGPGCPYP